MSTALLLRSKGMSHDGLCLLCYHNFLIEVRDNGDWWIRRLVLVRVNKMVLSEPAPWLYIIYTGGFQASVVCERVS